MSKGMKAFREWLNLKHPAFYDFYLEKLKNGEESLFVLTLEGYMREFLEESGWGYRGSDGVSHIWSNEGLPVSERKFVYYDPYDFVRVIEEAFK